MAYVFSGINQALAGKSDEAQKADIFNADPAVTGDGPGATPAADDGMKTSTEGELGATGAAAANAGTSEQDPQTAEVANGEVVKRNLDKVKGPKGVDRVKADLDTAEAGVQAEADNYIKDWSNRDYSLDTGTIDKALGDDEESYKKTAERLARTGERADQFDVKTDYDVEDTNLLRNEAGVQELMRRDADSGYNAGESAFDMMLLRRNKGFNQLRDQLVNRQDGLRKNVDDYRTSKTDEAQKITDERFGKATDEIKGYLGKNESDMLSAWKAKVAEEDAAREALRAGGGDKDFIAAQSKAAIDELVAEYQATGDPNALRQIKFIQDNGLDASQYYGIGRDLDAEKDYGAVVDDAGAKKFNRIMALLGKGDSLQAGAGLGERQGFDAGGFREGVKGAAAQKRQAADSAAQAELAKIEREIQGRASQSNVNWRNTKDAEAAVARLVARYGSDIVSKVRERDDWQQFVNKDYGWQNEVTQADLDRMNQYYSELGTANNYGVGTGKSFDSDGYYNALAARIDAALSGQRGGDGGRSSSQTATKYVDEKTRSADKATGGHGKGLQETRKKYGV